MKTEKIEKTDRLTGTTEGITEIPKEEALTETIKTRRAEALTVTEEASIKTGEAALIRMPSAEKIRTRHLQEIKDRLLRKTISHREILTAL